MSFDKHYPHRKDQRRQYIARGKCDRSCRPHEGCPYCEKNRRNSNFKKKITAEDKLKEFTHGTG